MPPMKRRDERLRVLGRVAGRGSLGGDVLSAGQLLEEDDLGGFFDGEDGTTDPGGEMQWMVDLPLVLVAGIQDFDCSYVPVEESLTLRINGLRQREGTDYSVDWSTGVVSYLTDGIVLGDTVKMQYMTKGDAIVDVQDEQSANDLGIVSVLYHITTHPEDPPVISAFAIRVLMEAGDDPNGPPLLDVRGRILLGDGSIINSNLYNNWTLVGTDLWETGDASGYRLSGPIDLDAADPVPFFLFSRSAVSVQMPGERYA